MMKKMSNKDLAKKLKISPAALSLIINNKSGVSEDTRNRVKKSLAEMGYEHLIKREVIETNNICFVIFKNTGRIINHHSFFLLMMETIEKQAAKYGYNIFLVTIDANESLIEQFERINTTDAKGVVIFGTEIEDKHVPYFSHLTLPFVILDNDLSQYNLVTVSINNAMGTFQAIEYLVNNNHTDIGYLQSFYLINSFIERKKGFESALQQFGIDLPKEKIVVLPYTEEGSYQTMKKWLTTDIYIPKAFVTDDDTIAVGAMKALQEFGYKIPEDIAIVGYNNRPNSEITTPSLTTIDVNRQHLGIVAVDTLMKLIDQETSSNFKIRINTELIKRGSV